MQLRQKITRLYTLLIAFNILVWLAAVAIYAHHLLSFSLCLLAYGFGLRHGIDADHIAAIDSVTRKLTNKKDNPVGIGVYFSLGHSAVVVILSLLVVLTTTTISKHFPAISSFGTFFGSLLAATFLLLFAVINFSLLCDILRNKSSCNTIKPQGLLGNILKPLFKVVNKSWHMLLVGFLFGLGFDTATEVALLGISGQQALQHASVWIIMLFPALFAAGMVIADTTSGLLMLGACRWTYLNPARNRSYNLTITALSFITATIIGVYELINICVDPIKQHVLYSYLANINNHFTLIGCIIIILFSTIWGIKALASN